jgi:hypothetical protein
MHIFKKKSLRGNTEEVKKILYKFKNANFWVSIRQWNSCFPRLPRDAFITTFTCFNNVNEIFKSTYHLQHCPGSAGMCYEQVVGMRMGGTSKKMAQSPNLGVSSRFGCCIPIWAVPHAISAARIWSHPSPISKSFTSHWILDQIA